MASKKKLQVFVSSTYEDLKEERQAAVQAILSAGHIPAGMELFAAGDESQMDVIKRWIGESDVYLLILGGRYGSIEPKSGKSYTQLEFDYAVKQKKALFSVVISESALEARVKNGGGTKLIERNEPQKLKEFRKYVTTSKVVRFWDDAKDIQMSVIKTLNEYSQRDNLVGWIPGGQVVDTTELGEEIARLTRINAQLVGEKEERDELLKRIRVEPEETQSVLDENDIEILLKQHINSKRVNSQEFALSYQEVDQELGLETGMGKKLLGTVAKASGYRVIREGATLISLQMPPPTLAAPPRSSSARY